MDAFLFLGFKLVELIDTIGVWSCLLFDYGINYQSSQWNKFERRWMVVLRGSFMVVSKDDGDILENERD